MKKYICFVLVFLMFSLIISSHAEVFSLRKGIQFGDSIEAVIEKTKEDGVEFTDDDSTEGTHSLNSNPGIEIAGIEGTFQHYFFNEEGALYSVKFELPYDFGKVDFNSLSSVDDFKNFVQTIPNGLISGKDTYNLEPGNLYYDLISRLTDKYGNPLTVDKSAFQGKTLADAIEYRGANPVVFNGEVPSSFNLPFYAKDQHDITSAEVELTNIAAIDNHGLVANPISDATGTVLIHDANPLVPAVVAMTLSDVAASTENEFEMVLSITSTEQLTSMGLSSPCSMSTRRS